MKTGFFQSFSRFALKQNCLGKLSDIAFVYLLCPIMLKNPQITSWDVMLHNLGSNLARIANFPQEGISW